MKKLFLTGILTFIMLLCVLFTGCGNNESAQSDNGSGSENDAKTRVITLKGPTGMGMAKLISDGKSGQTKGEYEFTVASAADEITAEIIKGNFDVAAVPVNLASVLYKKTEGNIKIAGINTLGVLYMLENGTSINSVTDLKGKTIYSVGQGSTPEYILKYVLEKNGLDPEKDVTIEYYAENAELVTALTAGNAAVGFLPEPAVTSAIAANSDLRIALNFNDEWSKISETKLVQGVIIVNSDFAEEKADTLDIFMDEYKASVDFALTSTEETAKLIEEAGIVPKAALAMKALPNCNICFITGEEMKSEVSGMLNVLYEANPASVGGSIPDDGVYLIK